MFLLCGSKESRKPSPKKFIANKKTVIAIAGTKSSHGYNSIPFTPSDTKDPHDASGAETPKPKKDKKLSLIINEGMESVE